MKDAAKQLAQYHNQVVAWAQENIGVRTMAKNLRALGLRVDHNQVYRYIRKHRIPIQKPQQAGELFSNQDQQQQAADQTTVKQGQPDAAAGNAAAAPGASELARRKPTDFPTIDTYRPHILRSIRNGCSTWQIHRLLQHACGLQSSEQELTAYIECLLDEMHPLGSTSSALFQEKPTPGHWPDSMEMLSFGTGRQTDTFRLSDFFQGIMVFGAKGSGKTSGSGAHLAMSCLQAGFGMLILTTKTDEAYEWIKRAMKFGRAPDVSVIRPDGFLTLNAIEYERNSPDGAGMFVENLIDLFKNLVAVLSTDRASTMNESFWKNAGDELLRTLFLTFLLAHEPITIEALAAFVDEAPQEGENIDDLAWRERPIFGKVFSQAQANAKTIEEHETLTGLRQYLFHHFKTLNPATKSSIVAGFTSMINILRTPQIRRLVSGRTTITPDQILAGRIIIVDLPVNVYHSAGLLVQAIWKYLTERAILRRSDKYLGVGMKPAVIWEDEVQNFVIPYDAEYQRVARDCRGISVCLTQSMTNLIDRFGGGDSARVKVQSILANLNVRIFHANGCLETNRYASDSIGTYEKVITDTSSTPQNYAGIDPVKSMYYRLFKKPVVTTSNRTHREPLVHPHEFSLLKPGGAGNNMVTEAIMTQVGRTFYDGKPYRRVFFDQLFFPDPQYTDEEFNQSLETVRAYATRDITTCHS